MTLPHLRRLLPALLRHRRLLLLGLLALALTTGVSVAGPWVLRHAIDDLTLAVTQRKLWLYAGAILALVAVEGVFRYQMRMILIGLSREIEYELRNQVFEHLTKLSASYYQRNRIGEVMSRATNDMSAVRMVLGPGIMYTASTVATSRGRRGRDARDLARGSRCSRCCRSCWSRCWCATSAARCTTASRRCRPSSPSSTRSCRRTWRARAWCAPTRRKRPSRLRFAAANHEYVDAQPAARAHHRHPAPRHRLPDGPRRRDRALARRPHGDRGRHHARRARRVLRLPDDAATGR